MGFDVFISYSSKDKPAADAACAVLESRGVRCWIAPRDILPGADWSQSIMEAINVCRAMVLIFSSHANASQQVKREVERVVNRGRPIIPVRIEEVLPAQALEYFLSTPHWLDAFTPPLEQHLERLATTIRQLLDEPSTLEPAPPPSPKSKPWRRYVLPAAVTAATCAALILLAVIAFRDNRPRTPPSETLPPSDALAKENENTAPASNLKGHGAGSKQPDVARLVGRWQGEIPDDDGKKHTGLMDVKDTGGGAGLGTLGIAFSDGFALPYGDASGVIYVSTDKNVDFGGGVVPRSDKDTGSFRIVAGGGDLAGMYRLEDGDKNLVMRVKAGLELRWKRVASDGPLSQRVVILPDKAEWPIKDVNGMTRRAREYVRGRWQPDAELVEVRLECVYAFGMPSELKAAFLFRSAARGKGLQFDVGPTGTQLAETANGRGYPALPARFPELAEVMAQKGVTAKQLTSAELEYRYYYDNTKFPNKFMPPCPYPKDGFYWLLRTEPTWHYVPVAADQK